MTEATKAVPICKSVGVALSSSFVFREDRREGVRSVDVIGGISWGLQGGCAVALGASSVLDLIQKVLRLCRSWHASRCERSSNHK